MCFSTLQLLFVKEATSNLLVNSVGSSQAPASQIRKRHANLQERIQGLWNTTNLFNKPISLFKGGWVFFDLGHSWLATLPLELSVVMR